MLIFSLLNSPSASAAPAAAVAPQQPKQVAPASTAHSAAAPPPAAKAPSSAGPTKPAAPPATPPRPVVQSTRPVPSAAPGTAARPAVPATQQRSLAPGTATRVPASTAVAPVVATEYRGKLAVAAKKKITGFEWDKSPNTLSPVIQFKKPNENRPDSYVILQGRFVRPGWTLLYGTRPIRLAPDGRFAILIPILGSDNRFQLRGVSPQGAVEFLDATILFQEWAKMKDDKNKSTPFIPWNKRIRFSPGFGFTYVNYKQEVEIGTLTGIVTTGKFMVLYGFDQKQKWDVALSSYFTLLPLTYTPSDYSISFLGVNFRAGYHLMTKDMGWKFSFLAGWYYITSFTNNDVFGFNNIQGPQIFPMVTKIFKNGKAAWLYFKFSPMLNGTSFMALTSSEIAVGAGVSLGKVWGRNMSLTLDTSFVNLDLESTKISFSTYSLGIGYQLF